MEAPSPEPFPPGSTEGPGGNCKRPASSPRPDQPSPGQPSTRPLGSRQGCRPRAGGGGSPSRAAFPRKPLSPPGTSRPRESTSDPGPSAQGALLCSAASLIPAVAPRFRLVPAGSDEPDASLFPRGGGEGRWRRPAAGEERGHGVPRGRLDSCVMAASPQTLSSRLLTGTAPHLGHGLGGILFSLPRATPWFRLSATLGALGEVGWGIGEGSDLRGGLK